LIPTLTHTDLNNSEIYVEITSSTEAKIVGITGWEKARFLHAVEALSYPEITLSSNETETKKLQACFLVNAGSHVSNILSKELHPVANWLVHKARVGMHSTDIFKIKKMVADAARGSLPMMPNLEPDCSPKTTTGQVNEYFSKYRMCKDWVIQVSKHDVVLDEEWGGLRYKWLDTDNRTINLEDDEDQFEGRDNLMDKNYAPPSRLRNK
jgi:hypothetical protein